MAQSLAAKGRLLVKSIVLFQCVFALFCASASYFLWDQVTAISVLIGGLISAVPNFLFGALAFKYAGAAKNKLVVQSLNKGSKLKFLTTIVFLVVAFQWTELNAVPMLVAFAATTVAQWPYLILTKPQ